MAKRGKRAAGRRWRAGEHGQNLVEFSLVVPMLFMLVFGIFEFGNVLRTQVELQNATREGGRFASLNDSDASLQSDVTAQIQQAAPDLSGLSVTITKPYACTTTSPEVKVSTTYSYTSITPVSSLLALFGGSFNAITLSSASTFRNECA